MASNEGFGIELRTGLPVFLTVKLNFVLCLLLTDEALVVFTVSLKPRPSLPKFYLAAGFILLWDKIEQLPCFSDCGI